MTNDLKRSARIIESQLVGDGSATDRALRAMAAQSRTMAPDRHAISRWVGSMGRLRGIDDKTIKAITDAITDDVEAE